MPSLSVIVTTYNRRDFLRETLNAIAAQTVPPLETIVVDDGSTDGTAEMISADFPWVRIIEQQNTGLSAARNHGIAVATGEWVGFCDDDDVWLPSKIESLTTLLADHSVAAIYHPVQPFDGDRDFGAPIHGEDVGADSYRACLVRPPSVPSGMVVRRVTALRAGLFPPDIGFGEDWAFALNVARLTRWTLHPRALTRLRSHPGRSSSGTGKRISDSYVLPGVPLRVWYAGRPLPQRVSIEEQLRTLEQMGPVYREIYRSHFREILRRRSWREARIFWRVLTLLLPRRRDRTVVLVPGSGRLIKLSRALRSLSRPPVAPGRERCGVSRVGGANDDSQDRAR